MTAPVELFRTEIPTVWLARSRSQPHEYHLIYNVGLGFEICKCPGFGWTFRCDHVDAVIKRVDKKEPSMA